MTSNDDAVRGNGIVGMFDCGLHSELSITKSLDDLKLGRACNGVQGATATLALTATLAM
jgi:hypothetical protein